QAQILERAGRVDDAIEQLRRASDVSSVLGDWKKLESILRLMIRIRPDDMDVRHSAATKFIEFGQIQLAIEQLWGVVEVSSRQNNPDDTIAALHQIIALGPQEVDAYHRLGEVLASVGEFAQAERVYRRLATLVPDDPAIQAKQMALAAMARGGS
ncbi:MAG TPA: tetratricopeptide repeat protein, partial [Nitrolancea sp.]|nr:tetratricopeptide repeat protein [Nitrolancea sp.]